MNYQQLQEIKDLLESCYVNMIAVNLKKEVFEKIIEIKKEMNDYDLHISQQEEEAKYGKTSD